jgi:DNA-binding FadR family transcriptional regulator
LVRLYEISAQGTEPDRLRRIVVKESIDAMRARVVAGMDNGVQRPVKVPRQLVHIAIAQEIGVSIVTGRTAPGTVLNGEVAYAAEHGVSRSAVREAMRMLDAKGLVESRPKTGTRVRPRSDWNLLDPILLAWMFEAEPPADFVRSLFELRMIIEPAACEIAAANRNGVQLARMGHALETMARHTLASEAGQVADQLFHHILLEATGNELLVNLSGSITSAVRWTTIFKHRKQEAPRDSIPQHRALYAAIADGDPVAARTAMVTLLEQAREDTEQRLGL